MSSGFNIQEELKKLPDTPGVYLHKDEFGQIIYVGKAISLKRRVSQYFRDSKNHGAKTKEMVKHIAEFEYINCGSEMEALILECNLIKKYKPKYNILLRDDKTYPYIKVTLSEEYPRILKTRRLTDDGSKYFGPYADASAVNTIINMLNDLYSLKRCNAQSFGDDFRPCLNYHIHQCRGICTGNVSKEDYHKAIELSLDFLYGRSSGLNRELKEKMQIASGQMCFEDAAKYRDCLAAIELLNEKQRVVLSHPENLDVVLVVSGISGDHALLFTVREGKLSGRESFYLGPHTEEEDRLDNLSEFIRRYYHENIMVPKEILVSKLPSDSELLSCWLSAQSGHKVEILSPMRGEKKALMDVALQDAHIMLADIDARASRQIEKNGKIISGLSEIFGSELAEKIRRVESYDISNIFGTDSVGAMVVFEDGYPLKKAYRRFKIRTVDGADDTASLTEVLFRRYKNAVDKVPGFEILPDAIFMDGGAGQVKAAKDVLYALRLDIPVAGMVKDDHHRTRALLYEGEEYSLKGKPELYTYFGSIQEEVHRFAIEYHRNIRNKSVQRSVLDNIPGIGSKRKMELLNKFGSVENIKNADVTELENVVNSRVAEEIKKYFDKE